MFNTKAIKATILFTAVCVFGWIAHGVQTLAQIEITNEVYTAAQTDAKIVELAPAPGNYAIVSNRAMMAIQGVEYVYGVDVAITNYPNGVGFDFRNGIMFDFSEGGSGIPYYAYLRPERGPYSTAFSWLLPLPEDYQGDDDIFLASKEDVVLAADAATNYTDAAIAKLSGMLSITGEVKPLSSQYADSAQSALFLQGDETLYSPYDLMRESTNAALAVTLAFSNNVYRSLSSKQDALPYPTNAIPYSVLTNIPTIRSDMITDGTNTLSANLDYEYEKVLTNTWVVNGIPYTTTTGYTSCSYFPPNPNENDMGYTLTLSEDSSWESGYYDLSIGAWYWRNKGTEEDPDYQWESDSGGTTGLLPANGTSFSIDGFVGTYPIKRMETSKLALTNDIPPAVTVVAPSTNAEHGTAADAKATGIALYTGYTTWEPYGENPGYKLISVEYNSGSWKVVYIVDGDSTMYTKTTSGAEDETELSFHSDLNSITRHLVTPTRTSQIKNDGNGTNMFATVNQIPTRAVETNEYGEVQASITFRKVNEYGTPADTEVKIGSADAYDTHNKLLVEGSYNGGEVYVSGRYGEGGIRILGGGSEAYPDDGGKIIIDGTNIVPVVFGAAQSIDTNYNDFAFVKDDGTIYYKVMEGVWSTVIGENYISGARLYSYAYGPTTNWTWYVTGGTSSSFSTFEAPLDATELKFRYNPSTTNKFYRGSNVARLGMVGNMIASNVVSLVTNINADVRIKGTFSQGTNTLATGIASHAEGGSTTAEGNYAHSEGNGTYARGVASHGEGLFTRATERAAHSSGACALATNSWSFVWSGLERSPYYGSHGVSTFNVNPINGINGFYIGEQTLQQAIVASIMDTSLSNDIEVVYQNQDNADAAMISDIVVTQAVTNYVPTIRTAVSDVVDNAIGRNLGTVQRGEWTFSPSGYGNKLFSIIETSGIEEGDIGYGIYYGEDQIGMAQGLPSTNSLTFELTSPTTMTVIANRYYELQDRSMNIFSTSKSVPFSFPKPVPNKYREFRLRLVLTQDLSGTDKFSFSGATTNGVQETISFETEDGTFPSVTTISTNLYHFVETAPSIFYVEKKQLMPAPLY